MSDEYNLLMPFVVCKSEGGPYDDESFVAGYQAAIINCTLANGIAEKVAMPVRTMLLPQVDLIAMRHGYRVTSEPTILDEWTHINLIRNAS